MAVDSVFALDYGFTALLDIIGFIQGIILGILLICAHKKGTKLAFLQSLWFDFLFIHTGILEEETST